MEKDWELFISEAGHMKKAKEEFCYTMSVTDEIGKASHEDIVVNFSREENDNECSCGDDVDYQDNEAKIKDTISVDDQNSIEKNDYHTDEYEDLKLTDIIDIRNTRGENGDSFGSPCEDQVDSNIQSEKCHQNTRDGPISMNNEHEYVDISQNKIDIQVEKQEVDKTSIGVNEVDDMNFNSFESINQFACLYEESAVKEGEFDKYDFETPHGMFIIGKKNIFKIRSRKLKHLQPKYRLIL